MPERDAASAVCSPHVKRQDLLAALGWQRQRLEALLELRLHGRLRLPPALGTLLGVTQSVPQLARALSGSTGRVSVPAQDRTCRGVVIFLLCSGSCLDSKVVS